MNSAAITPTTAFDPIDTEAQKRTQSSRDFEALLIGQMLHSVRDEDSGWLGSGGDESADAAFGLGEEQLAQSIAKGGGLGLAKMIDRALEREESIRQNAADAASEGATQSAPDAHPALRKTGKTGKTVAGT